MECELLVSEGLFCTVECHCALCISNAHYVFRVLRSNGHMMECFARQTVCVHYGIQMHNMEFKCAPRRLAHALLFSTTGGAGNGRWPVGIRSFSFPFAITISLLGTTSTLLEDDELKLSPSLDNVEVTFAILGLHKAGRNQN